MSHNADEYLMDVRACKGQCPIIFLCFTAAVIADDMEFVSFPQLNFDG